MSSTAHVWNRAPEATALFDDLFRSFATANPLLAQLEDRFLSVAGVRIQNLVDHWILPTDEALKAKLPTLGLVEHEMPEGDRVWKHPGARLPALRFKSKRTTPCLALLVENIDSFANANEITLDACHGDIDSGYQCAHLSLPAGELMPITRQGYNGYAPGTLSEAEAGRLATLRQKLSQRQRVGEESTVIALATDLARELVTELGIGRATDEFFLSERNYYIKKNSAAQWQYAQQEKIGIDWANHDHHTYRSSRASFRALIQLFKTLGFVTRERFYAGAEAGWGAQVLEHPISRVVLFADVDIAPEELDIDFATVDLPERDTLGTIGLWCALHTSSIAEAGMHHIECEYDFERSKTLLEAHGHAVMPPFTDLPMLKQAFTVAEKWQVPSTRIQPLVEANLLTKAQGEQFLAQGAPGSHLEILQRWEGFKGFNKTGVSSIIRDTDARRET